MIPIATHGAVASFSTAGSSGAWTPSSLSLNVWLDAADDSTFSLSSSLVDQWNDKSGNNRHFTQTGSARPTRGTNTVVFDGSDDFIAGSHGLGTNPSTFTVFFAIKMNDVASGSCRSKVVIGNRSSASPIAFIGMPQNYVSTDWGVRAPDADRSAGIGQATVGTHVYGLIKSGTNYFVSANGTLSGSISISASLVFTDLVEIGRSSPYVWLSYFSMEMYELLISNQALTTADRQKLEGYLAHKWGIASKLPSSHPYKNSPP